MFCSQEGMGLKERVRCDLKRLKNLAFLSAGSNTDPSGRVHQPPPGDWRLEEDSPAQAFRAKAHTVQSVEFCGRNSNMICFPY